MRRQLAVLTGAEAEAGQCWLQHAKLCRVSGHFEAATTASLQALQRQVPGADLEHARLLWDMDKPHRAIISLQEVGPAIFTLHATLRFDRAGIMLPVELVFGCGLHYTVHLVGITDVRELDLRRQFAWYNSGKEQKGSHPWNSATRLHAT